MRKRNEYTGKFINVTKVDTIFRTSDSIAKFLDSANSDSEAVNEAQKYIDEIA